MYGETKNIPINKQPEHHDLAVKMAMELIERFSPMEQNECINLIFGTIKEAREKQLYEANERVVFLQKSLEILK